MQTSTPTQILMSPTNNSTAKAQYSFAKAPRFPASKPATGNFYNIPPAVSSRATSLGYGNKYDFTSGKEKTPDPGEYKVSTDIANTGKAITFGISRETSKRYIKGHNSPDPVVPGPGAYPFSPKFGREGRVFTMAGRTDGQKAVSLSPGPGAYDQKFEITKGNYVLSTYRNMQVHTFAPSTLTRLNKPEQSRTPAPGFYDVDKGFLRNSELLSTVKSNGSRKFSLSERMPLNPKSESPGPGAYRLPSEFGYYEAPNNFCKTTSNLHK